MTQVDFHINIDDKILHACKVVRKALNAGKKVVCFSTNTRVLQQLDESLWSFSATDFLPHVFADTPEAKHTPILLTHDGQGIDHHEVLLNLDLNWPPFFSRFERLIELVGLDETDKTEGRTRFKFYRDRGYPLNLHDLTKT